MVIEVLHEPGRSNHRPAIGALKSLLASEAMNVPIHQIAVTDEVMARLLEFPGSPTVATAKMHSQKISSPMAWPADSTRQEKDCRPLITCNVPLRERRLTA